MEESTCNKIVINLFNRFICMKCLFIALFISSKYDFYADDEGMIAKA